MHPRLVGLTGVHSGRTFPLDGSDLIIGRSRGCWLTIPTTLVSRTHCRLERDAQDNWTLHDLDSHNGTRVNQTPIHQRLLVHGDQVQIGDCLFVFLLYEELEDSAELSSGVYHTQTIAVLPPSECVYFQPEPGASRAERQLSALLALSSAIHGLRSVEELGRQLAERIFEITPAERMTILWRDSPTASCEPILKVPRQKGPTGFLQPSATVIERVLESGNGVLSGEVSGEYELWKAKSLADQSVRSVLAVPMGAPEFLRGVLYLDTCEPAMPFQQEHLHLVTAIGVLVAAALENILHAKWLESENQRLRAESGLEHEMIGESPAMQDVYEKLARVAQTGSTVLICGESGTGKELAARAVHRSSDRAGRAFVAINCAAIAESLLESELFGHEKGAFTGAIVQKKGKIEVAEGGTLFLDEIGELAPLMQAKLLRVIQEREFERVGGTKPLRADVRIIAATNRSLEEAIQIGTFRQDLYYRLNVVTITMPALRQRREDIPLLCGHFISLYSARCKRSVTGISPQVRHCFMNYDWPGNVRELQNVIERAVVLGSADMILPEDLPEELHASSPEMEKVLPRYLEAVQETKRAQILQAVQESGGNITSAAKLLGVHPNYLHRLIRNLGLRQAVRKNP